MYKWPLMKNTITLGDKWNMIKFIATTERFTNGQKVREFEEAWNKWLGSKYSLYVTSGSTANLLLISSVKELYKISNHSKVLVPACTWVTNIAPVIQCGLEPIFCDVNLENYSFDEEHLSRIAVRHPDIKIIFATHLLGFSANNELLKSLWPDAIILDDICESHGVTGPDGVKRGANSVGATFSFYFGHHMTTVEGGMVSTNDPELYALMKTKRSHGLARELPPDDFKRMIAEYPDIDPQFMFVTDGYNFRNMEINAVLGLSQLKRLDKAIDIRRKNFKLFLLNISRYSDYFYMPFNNEATNSSYAFPIVAKDANVARKLKVALEEGGIETRPIVGGNLLRQPFLRNYIMDGGAVGNFKVDILNDNGVYVGNNHLIGAKEINSLKPILKEVTR